MKGNLPEGIRKYLDKKTAIVGIGNTLKGDDAAGPLLISRLRGKTGFALFDCGQAPENYLQPIIECGPEAIIIVDASDWAGEPGELRLIKKEEIRGFGFSTHDASLRIFIDYLERELPAAELVFIGVQAGSRMLGQLLSPEVGEAVDKLAGFFEIAGKSKKQSNL
jgi:hydrogenase 3 maturation protease